VNSGQTDHPKENLLGLLQQVFSLVILGYKAGDNKPLGEQRVSDGQPSYRKRLMVKCAQSVTQYGQLMTTTKKTAAVQVH